MTERIGMALLKAMRSRVKLSLEVWRLLKAWRAIASGSEKPIVHRAIRRLVIIPSDPFSLIGAKGDEAMMLAAVDRLSGGRSNLQVSVLTATTSASEAARSLGFIPVQVWDQPWSLRAVHGAVTDFRPDFILAIGADVLDGSYQPLTAIRMLAVADLVVRSGVPGCISGFSMSERASRLVARAFDRLVPGLAVNLRDEISLRRFKTFSRADARLVADVAFLLKPDLASARVHFIRSWVSERSARGDVVIGFNLHPMLIDIRSSHGARPLIDAAKQALTELLRQKAVSIVLLSHDHRGEMGDDSCLGPLYEGLEKEFGERLLLPPERLRAAEVKAATAGLHGVVTGRMHLAIASLGMGTPVAALTYQDKFEGLFRHFDLPDRWLLDPAGALEPHRLMRFVSAFIDELPELRARVRRKVKAVEAAAESNFRGVLAERSATSASGESARAISLSSSNSMS